MDRSKMVNTNQILYPAKNARRWFGMDYEVSMYLPSHPLAAVTEKGGYEDFDAGIPIANSIELLMKDLTGKPTPSLIGFGTMVDPYNPSEEQSRLTRSALEIIHSNHQGVILFTKGEGILQDLDLLKKIAEDAFVVVVLIITSMNDELTKKIEPHAPLSSTRFKTLHKLANEKIKTGVLMMPIIPFITDTEENVTQIIRRSKEMGAEFIYPSFGINLTETDGQQFHKMIDHEFPGLKNIYMDTYGSKRSCQSLHAAKLKKAFVIECKKQKLKYGMNDIIKTIRPVTSVQMKLF